MTYLLILSGLQPGVDGFILGTSNCFNDLVCRWEQTRRSRKRLKR